MDSIQGALARCLQHPLPLLQSEISIALLAGFVIACTGGIYFIDGVRAIYRHYVDEERIRYVTACGGEAFSPEHEGA